jgi:trans-aconitate methyltransferase
MTTGLVTFFILGYFSVALSMNPSHAHTLATTFDEKIPFLAGLFDFNGKSVLDVGCGDGQLKEFLSKRYKNFSYIGVDQQPEFILFARNKYSNDEKCTFMLGDFSCVELPESDVVVASGALSYRCEDPEYYTSCIEKLFRCARSALIINMLDQSKMFPDEMIVGHDFKKVANYCRTLTVNTVAVTNYLYFDFTLMLSKLGKT